MGLASWEPSPKGCDEWCELMRQTVAESARPVIRSVGIERARGMGVVAAYRLGSLLGNSRHLEMPEPLQTRVSEALSVLMDHDASRVRVTAAAEVRLSQNVRRRRGAISAP